MAPPPPATVEILPVASPPKPSHQRHQRCRLSAYGLRHLHGAKQKSGVIVGESMNGTCWRIRFDGRKSVTSYRKDFIEIVGEEAEAA